MIKTADWIVDMGPDGGTRGGLVVSEGTPEQVAADPDSHTGEFLRRLVPPEALVSPAKGPRKRSPSRKGTRAKAS